MRKCFRVFDYIQKRMTDSAAIETCMEAAIQTEGEKTVLFDGQDYLINRAILVPSDTEIIIDGCSIKQNDEVFDNVFRGANVIVDGENPYGVPLDVKPQRNIKIIGKNGAKIIGTDRPRIGYHPVLDNHQMMNGDFWGWRTHMFSFSLGENIEIAGLSLSQTMGWAISFDCCSAVYVHDLTIRSNVKNGDGIDFRSGCHDCIVENISGFTSDDTVACTALASDAPVTYPVKNYIYPSEPFCCLGRAYNKDIYNVKIQNVTTGGFHHGIICLAAKGNKVYNILIEDIHEAKEGNRESTVKIYTGYGDGYTEGDIHDISVKNVTGAQSKYTVQFVADVENVFLENIVQNNPEGALTLNAEQDGVTIR